VNYRKYDIVEFEHKGKLKTGTINSFDIRAGVKIANIVLHGTKSVKSGKGFWSWNYYPTEKVDIENIKRVIVRQRGKGYKKVPIIIHIDEHGNEIHK
jgi:hypothetical protein